MWMEAKEAYKRLTFGVRVATLLVLVAVCSCSSRAGLREGDAGNAARASADNTSGTSASPVGGFETSGVTPAGVPDFTLVNFARTNLYAVYVSPHDSTGWEENVLGRDLLFDGENVKIRFSPEEKAVIWDLRVEDVNGNSAEWKNLNLREISKITLRATAQVVTAEAE